MGKVGFEIGKTLNPWPMDFILMFVYTHNPPNSYIH